LLFIIKQNKNQPLCFYYDLTFQLLHLYLVLERTVSGITKLRNYGDFSLRRRRLHFSNRHGFSQGLRRRTDRIGIQMYNFLPHLLVFQW